MADILRRTFSNAFSLTTVFELDQNFTKFVLNGQINKTIIVWGNDLAANRRQAITPINDVPVQ